MKKKITIHDLAKILKIDSSTVSRALANSPRVKQKTRDLVLSKAEELGYSRNIIASNLRSKRTRTIGVIVPHISRYFLSTVIAGIEEQAFKSGYHVVIGQSLDRFEREKELVKTLLSYQVDGIIISISMETDDYKHLQHIVDQETQLVFFDRKCESIKAPNIYIDDYQRAFEATQHLIENGCKRIAHFTGSDKISIYQDRKKGYIKALAQNKIEVNQALILQSQMTATDGTNLAAKILEMQDRPDGIFCANDVSAISAIQYLADRDINVPNDIAVVGFSNEPLGRYTSPPLTTVNQSPEIMGKTAFETMMACLSDHKTVHDTIIPSSVEIRKSSVRK